MKFLALALFAAVALATDQKCGDESILPKMISEIPEKAVKVHQFFKPHIDETAAVLKKNAKEIAVKAKPHVEKACKDFKAKEKEHYEKIKKTGGDLKKAVDQFGKSVYNLKDVRVQVTRKDKEDKGCTALPSPIIVAVPEAC
jgi:hypothetical protein